MKREEVLKTPPAKNPPKVINAGRKATPAASKTKRAKKSK